MMSGGSLFGRKTTGPGNGSRFLLRASVVLAVWIIFVGTADGAGTFKDGTLCINGQAEPEKGAQQAQIDKATADGTFDKVYEEFAAKSDAAIAPLKALCSSNECHVSKKTLEFVCGKPGSGSGKSSGTSTRPIQGTTAMRHCAFVSLITMVLTTNLV